MSGTDDRLSDYLTIEQVAAAAGCGARRILRLRAAGIIQNTPAACFGSRVMFHKSELAKIPPKQRGGKKRRSARRRS